MSGLHTIDCWIRERARLTPDRVAVDFDIRLAGETHPFLEVVRCDGGLELDALHVGREAGEATVPAAVVEMQVRVDHRNHSTEIRPRQEDRRPLLVELGRRVDHPRVDEDRPFRAVDCPAVHRPELALDGHVAEMERPNGVQSTYTGSSAVTRRARYSKTRLTATNVATA